ncbi:MAG TPA: beta-propeller fold lactonase family protein [Stellaceae bacterium]|jgi:6-phosphogluconolactonase|nr:beta-propeller fold lactonase family protein [Stellaceae bacterium]
MPYALYVGLQDDDKIATFALDADSGRLTPQADVPVAGGPSVVALSPDRQVLYVGHRGKPAISSYRIDQGSGALTLQGSVAAADAPTFLATDRTGKYLLSAYYQGGYAAVHPLGADGTVGAAALDRHETATGAHAIMTDPSNRFAFVPHIARLNDNVLEPPKNNPGPNVIMQFRFDQGSGRLTPSTPSRVEQAELVGPRHYCFHPTLHDRVYFSNEQGCGVSLYRLDAATGNLAPVQTIASLPTGVSVRNTCSMIHFTPSGRFLYVANRGHNSIAGFAVDAATGHLAAAGHASTEAVPSAFCVDPAGNFLFAAGTATGRLASYRINGDSGALTPLAVQAVGNRPAAVLATRLGS